MTTELGKAPAKDTEKMSERPPRYLITLHNDSSTMPDIVCHAICHLGIDYTTAKSIMMRAHMEGKAVCCTEPTKDMAETKVANVNNCPLVMGTELSFTVDPE